jgi:hypothetical protein
VHHVVGGELVAVGPVGVLAQVEGILGRVVVDLPALQQPGLEGEVGGVADQRLEEDRAALPFWDQSKMRGSSIRITCWAILMTPPGVPSWARALGAARPSMP